MTTYRWFRFFRQHGNGILAALRKALLIRRATRVQVFPMRRF
jgi:hypothetical protein